VQRSAASVQFATRAYRCVLVAVFVLGISLPLLDWRFDLDHTPRLTENRVPARAPDWPLDRRQWQALPASLEAYWNDAFGFRRQLIRWHAITRWALGVSASPNVIIGKHAFLFSAGDQSVEQHRGLRPFTDVELKNWAEQLEARRKWLEGRGAHYLFVIAPDKQSVYPNEVPERFAPFGRSSLDQLLDYLRSHTSVRMLDLRAPLRVASATGLVFLRTDSHWNDYGAFVGYTNIVHALNAWYPQMTPRPRASFSSQTTRPWNGDLATMLGGIYDVTTETSEAWSPHTPAAVVDVSATAGYRPPLGRRYSAYTGRDPARPRAVVFHDSFMLATDQRIFPGEWPARALLPPAPTFRQAVLLAEQFSRSVFTWQYAFDAQLVISEQPDLVIEEHLERLLIGGPQGEVPSPSP
jgi:alginate O-acetyltransferase complex protein AlgJ